MIYDPKEEEERQEIWKNRIIYSLPVRAGYWSNELSLREQNHYLFAYKKEHCQLLIQKTRKMFRNLLRPVTLALEAPYVFYGRCYMIKSFELTGETPCGKETKRPLCLSGLITEREIDHAQHFCHGCLLTASPSANPCVRNTFVFAACDADKTEAINYGEDVYIRAVESDGLPLYVQCENSTMDTFGKHLGLRLSQSPDIYCRFRILHWKPQLRYETSGTFVDHDAFVIVQHVASGHNLAAEFTTWLPTFFGSECAVTCHTFRDTHRMETAENLWKIVGLGKSDMELVKAARGEPDA